MSEFFKERERIIAEFRRRAADPGVAPRYDPLDPANSLLRESRDRILADRLRAQGLRSMSGLRILDIGCGAGLELNGLVRLGADPSDLVGVDLIWNRIAMLPELNPHIKAIRADGASLPFASGTFDAALLFTVLSSVPSAPMRMRVAGEAIRVLRGRGLILWYDFIWNPTNKKAIGINRSDLSQLFPGCRVDVRRASLAPPLARAVAPRALHVARMMGTIPFLRSHYAGIIKRADHR